MNLLQNQRLVRNQKSVVNLVQKSEDSSKKNNFYPLRDGSPNTTVPKSPFVLTSAKIKYAEKCWI